MVMASGLQDPQLMKLTQLDWNNGSSDRQKLPRGDLYRHLLLVLDYQLTVGSGGDNDQADVARGDAAAIIDSLEVKVSGNKDIKEYTGPLLQRQNHRFFGMPIHDTELGSSTTNPNCKMGLIVPFWKPDAFRPWEFSFDSSDFRNVSIEVEWNAATDVLSNASGFETDPTLDVYAKFADPEELRKQKGNLNFTIWRETVIEDTISQKGITDIDIPMDGLVPSMLINPLDDNNASGPGSRDDAGFINEYAIKSASDTPVEIEPDLGKYCLPRLEGISRDVDGSTGYEDLAIGDDNNLDDVYTYTHPDDGKQSESFDPKGRNLSELTLQVDHDSPGGNGKVKALVDQLFPPRNSGGNGNNG